MSPSVISRFRREDAEGAEPAPQPQQETLTRTVLQAAGPVCIVLAVLAIRSRIWRGPGSGRGQISYATRTNPPQKAGR